MTHNTEPNPPVQSLADYAEEHGIDPLGLLAIVNTDPDPVPVVACSGRILHASDGTYGDPLLPVEYMDMIYEGTDWISDETEDMA